MQPTVSLSVHLDDAAGLLKCCEPNLKSLYLNYISQNSLGCVQLIGALRLCESFSRLV